MGPRFYDWQLVRKAEESWTEYHLHARNLLGREEYTQLLARLIDHRIVIGDEHHDLLFGRLTRSLVQTAPLVHEHDGYSNPEARELRGVAEARLGYSPGPSASKGQTELLPPPQTDLFG